MPDSAGWRRLCGRLVRRLVSGQVPEDKAEPASKGLTVKKRVAVPEPAPAKAEVRLAAPMVIQGNLNGVIIRGNVNLNVNGMVVQWSNQFLPDSPGGIQVHAGDLQPGQEGANIDRSGWVEGPG